MSHSESLDLSGVTLYLVEPTPNHINHINLKKVVHRNNIFFLQKEYNEDYFKKVIEYMNLSQFSIMKDDIKNYNKLTEFQIDHLINLNEDEKIEIIKIYNNMIETIEYLHS